MDMKALLIWLVIGFCIGLFILTESSVYMLLLGFATDVPPVND